MRDCIGYGNGIVGKHIIFVAAFGKRRRCGAFAGVGKVARRYGQLNLVALAIHEICGKLLLFAVVNEFRVAPNYVYFFCLDKEICFVRHSKFVVVVLDRNDCFVLTDVYGLTLVAVKVVISDVKRYLVAAFKPFGVNRKALCRAAVCERSYAPTHAEFCLFDCERAAISTRIVAHCVNYNSAFARGYVIFIAYGVVLVQLQHSSAKENFYACRKRAARVNNGVCLDGYVGCAEICGKNFEREERIYIIARVLIFNV